ncbi:MAG: hypothetical protein V5A38_07750 [Halolamina sp.]|uniref:hypothetical protein n=1 Tax=Halolamina sp. TaxID=1940283 RepID=UPI002FC328CC
MAASARDGDDGDVNPPIKLYAELDEQRVALPSNVSAHVMDTALFAECLTNWVVEHDVLPSI